MLMILVTVVLAAEKIRSIGLSGHSGQAEKGHDVVCAGASSCFVGALNALAEPERFRIFYREGVGSIEALTEPGEHDRVVLEVLLRQLETIAESYPTNLKVVTERR